VDCSHANSGKDHNVQPLVVDNIASQIEHGNRSIIGVMLESHLNPGRQNIPKDLSDLEYGVSVTDACMGWDDTEKTLRSLASSVRTVLSQR
jgi:3-deoxy-7-phosphoheptulonate synthase